MRGTRRGLITVAKTSGNRGFGRRGGAAGVAIGPLAAAAAEAEAAAAGGAGAGEGRLRLDPDILRGILRSNSLRVLPPKHLKFFCDLVAHRRLWESGPIITGFHDGGAARAATLLQEITPWLLGSGDSSQESAITALQKALSEAQPYLKPPPRHRVPWHGYARRMAYIYAGVMQALYKVPMGSSTDGPVARFVAAMVPYISGEPSPPPATVAMHIKRQLKKLNDNPRLSDFPEQI
jgi:hypothetical protein